MASNRNIFERWLFRIPLLVFGAISISLFLTAKFPATPKPPHVIEMERTLKEVKPGDLLETKDGALFLVFKTLSSREFSCYRPVQGGGVEIGTCFAGKLASVIGRIVHPHDPTYLYEMMGFMQQMLPKEP